MESKREVPMLRAPLRPRRWLVAFLIVGLLAGPLAMQSQVQAATDLILGADAEVADAQGDPVNLRDRPSYTGNVLTSVPEGWLVNVLDGPFTDDLDGTVWYQVIANGRTGYMLSDYLRTLDEAVSAAAVATTTANLNLRSGPDANYGVLLVIPSGASVTTGAQQSGFTQVIYNGVSGWSASQYLSTSGGATATVIDGSLNLRSGPGTNYSIVALLPDGATVTVTGSITNGFYPVTYGNLSGYAAGQYLSFGSTPVQTATVIDGSLNLRSGPSTGSSVVTVMPDGATVTITGAQQNGFYPVTYGALAGYAYAQYLRIGGAPPPPPAIDTATATTGVNLRSGPGTSYSVLTVIPGGASVSIIGASVDGFYPVRYNGQDGYAATQYLRLASQPAPTPTPPPPAKRAAWTTADLNLRSGAGLSYGVITVMPAGAGISVTGAAQSGFYPVDYGTSSGFASVDYITFEEPPVVQPCGCSLIWPIKGGTWQIIQGYNGGTHNGSTYMYSLDLQRIEGEQATIGQTIYAPASGTVLWTSGGLLIGMGNGYGIALFHITLDAGITSGTAVTQGQAIGYISGPGGPGYQVTPHVDMTLWELPNGGGTPRYSAPYTGEFAIAGREFPPGDLAWNTWGGTNFQP